jgi:hypothetical protein
MQPRRQQQRHIVTRRVLWWVLAIWSAGLLVGSLGPFHRASLHLGSFHRLLHGLGFGVLLLLTRIAFPRRAFFVWQVLACVCLGVFIELLQTFVFGNNFEWEDIRDDAFGIMVFTALYSLARIVRRQPLQR